MATRRFGEGALAEEAALAVIDGLEVDNWARLRAHNNKASFATFIRILTGRLLEDFARKRYGRVRAPLWVTSFGGIWEKLFTALCLERLPLMEAVELVWQRQVVAKKIEIENAAYRLLAKIPGCGSHQGLEVEYEEDFSNPGQSDQEPLHSKMEEQQKEDFFEAIFQLLLEEEEGKCSEPMLEKVKLLEINLSSEERLLLKLCYQEGLTVTRAGQMLGLSRFQAHGKKRRLMARLKEEFERTGLAEELRPLFTQ